MTCNHPIEFCDLSYFIAAADQGSFRKAAFFANVHESSVSRRIRELEDRLGAALFHRQSGGVILTFAGRQFLPRARQIIKQVEYCATEVASIGKSELGYLKIGVPPSIGSGFISELLVEFSFGHPKVHIELVDDDPVFQISEIRQMGLDVVFLVALDDWLDCDTAELWIERVYVALPAAHIIAGKPELTWQDLAKETFISSNLRSERGINQHFAQRLNRLGFHDHIQLHHVGRENLLALVALGRGVALTSETINNTQFPGVVYRPIVGETLSFYAVWSPRNDNPAFRRFLSTAKSLARRSRSKFQDNV